MSQEIPWTKSSFSGGGGEDCVEIRRDADGAIRFRESDRPDEEIVTTKSKLAAFLRGAAAGEFDKFLD
ncbi:DUF397 domain-containing protein [Streptomyces sp. NPDC085479]|uniref:DUF397 domain-containing protein n=1 Tax=Streptomyces sp. NPDC085479 TaxID=3365726 RepID=UPI0037D93981